ncbi:hypothetical protein OpiT1DRAFT_03956 [Opitutaceae bacterium TAV1]|nr:hypothetical protein OpiT1DRAFT_03956 [Opitutaceae bacterium TAV1]
MWGKSSKATEQPKIAGTDADDYSTHQEAVPLRWFTGIDWCPLTWISPVYNGEWKPVKQKVGKKKETVGYEVYGDIAGLACVGLADRVLAIESDKEIVWDGAPIVRNDNPASPDYWRAAIPFDGGTCYVYWGRPDQPVDDILLAGINALGPDMKHPAYRGQVLVIFKKYHFGRDRTNVPSTRVLLGRAPQEAVTGMGGVSQDKGANPVRSVVELLTHDMHGVGLPATAFDAPATLATAAAIDPLVPICPYLERAQPARDVLRDLFPYYAGYLRAEGGLLLPGCNHPPPAAQEAIRLTDLSERPEPSTPTAAITAQEVSVAYRDAARKLKEDAVSETSASGVLSRRTTTAQTLDMPFYVSAALARQFAAEAVAASQAGEQSMTLRLRSARAVWAHTGEPYRVGEFFVLPDFSGVSEASDGYRRRVSRWWITRRVDYYDGKVELVLDRDNTSGLTISPETDGNIEIGKAVPLPIAAARIIDLPPALVEQVVAATGSDGPAIAVLALRPLAKYPPPLDTTTPGVVGYYVWHSDTGASYSSLVQSLSWSARGTLSAAITAGAASVQVTFPADNLDLDRVQSVSADDRLDNQLLAIVGNEVMSVGTVTLQAGGLRTLAVLRGRLGTAAAAAAAGEVVWVVWRDELAALTHAAFTAGATRRFKLQPFGGGQMLELEDAPVLTHTFPVPPAEVLPVIALGAVSAEATVGTPFDVTASVTAAAGNLASVVVVWVRLGAGDALGPEQALQAITCTGALKSACPVNTVASPMAAGRYRVLVRATTDAGTVVTAQSAVVVVEGAAAPEPEIIDFVPVFGCGGRYSQAALTVSCRAVVFGGVVSLNLHMAVRVGAAVNSGYDNTFPIRFEITEDQLPSKYWPVDDATNWAIQPYAPLLIAPCLVANFSDFTDNYVSTVAVEILAANPRKLCVTPVREASNNLRGIKPSHLGESVSGYPSSIRVNVTWPIGVRATRLWGRDVI